MTGKAKALFLLRYLKDHTDEGKSVSAAEIMSAFEKEGESITRPTLRENILSLQQAGFEILVKEIPGKGTFYKLTDREWTLPELQILVDAVASGLFISPQRSEKLIDKLRAMAGPTEREQLEPGIRVSDQVKAKNDQIIHIISTVKYAISQDQQIAFKHYEYDPDLKRVPKHKGYVYQVSPYALIWKKDRYYLVGWSEKHGRPAHFRIDRMGPPKLLEEKRRPAPEELRLEDRSDKIFSMFDGPEDMVVLRCRPHLMNQIVDQFGTKPDILRKDDKSLDVRVTVHLSPTFYGWLFQYAGEMKVVSPGNVCEQYAERLQTALDEVLG